MTNLDITDWISFCRGEKNFDKSHFYTLLMKTKYEEDISDDEYRSIFQFFPNTERLTERLKNYYSKELDELSINTEKNLIKSVSKDIKEKSALFKNSDIESYLSLPINYVDDIQLVLNAKKKNWQNEEFIDIIDDHVYSCLPNKKTVHALFEAFYGLSHNYQLVWYLVAPLINSSISFDNYYDIWKTGGDYAITEKKIIVSSHLEK